MPQYYLDVRSENTLAFHSGLFRILPIMKRRCTGFPWFPDFMVGVKCHVAYFRNLYVVWWMMLLVSLRGWTVIFHGNLEKVSQATFTPWLVFSYTASEVLLSFGIIHGHRVLILNVKSFFVKYVFCQHYHAYTYKVIIKRFWKYPLK